MCCLVVGLYFTASILSILPYNTEYSEITLNIVPILMYRQSIYLNAFTCHSKGMHIIYSIEVFHHEL